MQAKTFERLGQLRPGRCQTEHRVHPDCELGEALQQNQQRRSRSQPDVDKSSLARPAGITVLNTRREIIGIARWAKGDARHAPLGRHVVGKLAVES